MTLVTFVRHAQSISNAGQPTQHPSSVPITEMGYVQAGLVSQVFENAPELIVTSSFERTQTTAAPLIERFPGVSQMIWPVQEFTYMNPINWYGTTGEERTPSAHAYWERNDPKYSDGGGAESFQDLMQRADLVRDLVLQQSCADIVVYSHGMFTRAFWWRMLMHSHPINPRSMHHCVQFIRSIMLPNCSIVKFRFEEKQIWISGPQTDHLPPELITY